LRGQFPVGVFANASRANDLAMLERWRAGLGLIPAGSAKRVAFGRAHAAGAELLPALAIDLGDGRSVRLHGQTELLVPRAGQPTSVITMVREYERRSPYHLRGAFDHLVLAAAGRAPDGHAHVLLDRLGTTIEVTHAACTADEARGYLAGLCRELLDEPHGYLLPFDALATVLTGGKPFIRKHGDPVQRGLGFGPIERTDGLELPANAAELAQRRLGPLVARMRGDHGFEGRRK
jgi:hypothetical protein